MDILTLTIMVIDVITELNLFGVFMISQ